MKDYGGISPSRLELLELRLKTDVLNELEELEGKCVASAFEVQFLMLLKIASSY
jgi:hypothetical protein